MGLVLLIVLIGLLLGESGGWGYSSYGWRGRVGIGGVLLALFGVFLLAGMGRF